jgi:hypothetical protein
LKKAVPYVEKKPSRARKEICGSSTNTTLQENFVPFVDFVVKRKQETI